MKFIFNCVFVFLFFPIVLNAQNFLSGYVWDEDDQPYVGLELEIFETGQIVFTNIEGYYSFDITESGVYALVVKHPYHDIYKAVTVEDSTEYFVVIRREIRFDEVIVKATRASEKDPVSYSEVSGEQMAKQNYGQDVPYLLQWEPSMVVTSDAGTGIGYTGMRIRGSDPSRIAVTINGIPLNDAESQGVYWVDLPDFASSIDDVQIQRGVGSSTNGAGAFGGSMNFNTNQLHLDSYTKLNGSIGAYGTRKAGISVGTGLIEGHYGIDARYSTIQSNGYIDRASSKLNSLYLSGIYVGEDQSLRFTVFNGHEITYQAWNGLPVQYLQIDSLRTYNSVGQEKSDEPYDNEVDNYSQTHWQLFYNKEFNKKWNLAIAPFYTHGIGYYEQYKADQDISILPINIDTVIGTINDLIRRKWLNNHFFGASYSLNYSSADQRSDFSLGGLVSQYLGDHFGEILGIAYPDDSLYTEGLPNRYYDNEATKNDFNIFAKYAYRPGDHWQFIGDLQYRFVNYTYNGIVEGNRQINGAETTHFFNPKVGVSYFKKEHLFYLSFAKTGHEPNRSDYINASNNQTPNSEYLIDGELGYKWSSSKANIFLNAYYMQYDNQLALSGKLSYVGEYIRINIPESYRRGIEMGGIIAIRNINLQGNLTLSQNKVIEFTEYVDDWDSGIQQQIVHENTDLSFSPNLISSVGVDYNLVLKSKTSQKLNISYRLKYIGQQYLDNTSSETARLDAYNYSNLQLSYSISHKKLKEATLKFQINNLFNQAYVSNGWAYRFNYDDASVVDWNASAIGEEGKEGVYNLIGLYPQAGLHFMLGLDIKF